MEDENDIKVGDFVTLKITLVRENLKDGEEAGFVHAPRFPYLKPEFWYIILGDEKSNVVISHRIVIFYLLILDSYRLKIPNKKLKNYLNFLPLQLKKKAINYLYLLFQIALLD